MVQLSLRRNELQAGSALACVACCASNAPGQIKLLLLLPLLPGAALLLARCSSIDRYAWQASVSCRSKGGSATCTDKGRWTDAQPC